MNYNEVEFVCCVTEQGHQENRKSLSVFCIPRISLAWIP